MHMVIRGFDTTPDYAICNKTPTNKEYISLAKLKTHYWDLSRLLRKNNVASAGSFNQKETEVLPLRAAS